MTPIATTPYKQQSTLVLDLPPLDPADKTYDVTTGSDTLQPTRITLDYRHQPTAAIRQTIEATVKGRFRNTDDTISTMSNTAEVWRDAPADGRPAWVVALVLANLPDWWGQ